MKTDAIKKELYAAHRFHGDEARLYVAQDQLAALVEAAEHTEAVELSNETWYERATEAEAALAKANAEVEAMREVVEAVSKWSGDNGILADSRLMDAYTDYEAAKAVKGA